MCEFPTFDWSHGLMYILIGVWFSSSYVRIGDEFIIDRSIAQRSSIEEQINNRYKGCAYVDPSGTG